MLLAGSWSLEDVTVMSVGGKCVCVSGSSDVALTRCVLGGYRHTGEEGDLDLLSQMQMCAQTLNKNQLEQKEQAEEARGATDMSHTRNHETEGVGSSTETLDVSNSRETTGVDCALGSGSSHQGNHTDMLPPPPSPQLVEGRARYALQVSCGVCPWSRKSASFCVCPWSRKSASFCVCPWSRKSASFCVWLSDPYYDPKLKCQEKDMVHKFVRKP
jgi:hypothetical protein